jgi:lipopolysaccharide biosynthesis protein
MNNIRPIAIYLPQFHPIFENDNWWGKGFTEWTNVTKAKPRFEGHYQPHLPADLGFYDLRLEESRLAQEALAKEFGIEGFCYYHYWFNGKRILSEPIDRKLKNPIEDLPFFLCWANENWTRIWDGGENEVLLEQIYSEKDNEEHMIYLCENFFNDNRYMRVNGKPIFVIYKPFLIMDIKKTILLWRRIAREKGIGELHLGCMIGAESEEDIKALGFDFGVDFQPKFQSIKKIKKNFIFRIFRKIGLLPNKHQLNDRIYDYHNFVELQLQRSFSSFISPFLTPMWDNSSRRKKNAFMFKNSSPEVYGKWLKHIRDYYPWAQSAEKFIFINAWNEWAEGNHLEPCQKWGKQFLEKTKEIIKNSGVK